MVRGIYIPSNEDRALEERGLSTLDEYQAAVDGPIEPVDLVNVSATIYVNEEGLLRHLPLNARATFLWWYHVPAARQTSMLVGNALLVGLPDRHGNSTDFPVELSHLLAPATYRLDVKTTGDPAWYAIRDDYTDYWEALIWAFTIPEHVDSAEDARVVLVDPGSATRHGSAG